MFLTFNNFLTLIYSATQSSQVEVGESQYQLMALDIAAEFLDCDSSKILWLCAVRPSPFPNSLNWLKEADEWQEEHNLSIRDLVEKYVSKYNKNIKTTAN